MNHNLLRCALLGTIIVADSAQSAIIAHYSMEETNTPLIDQAGGQVANAVGAGHQYSVAGPAGFGNAVGLTANGSWQLSAAESTELGSLVNNFTVASWVYIQSGRYGKGTVGDDRFDRIIGDDTAWDGNGWAFGVMNDGRMIFTKIGVVDAYTSGAVTVPVGQWVHLAATVSSTAGVTFFINGNASGNVNNTANGIVGDDPYAVGRAYGSAGGPQWFPGRLDEVYVNNTVLTQSGIQALMIPEPSAALLGGLGLLVLARRRRA